MPDEAKFPPETVMVLPAIWDTGEKLVTETDCAVVTFAKNGDMSSRAKDM